MKELLRAVARGLWALRQVLDLAGILAISSLFILFGLQFKHPPAWDNIALLMRFRKEADPLLTQIASGMDLVWPAEKPSLLPLALSVAVFFVRSFLAHVLDGVSAFLRRKAGKPLKPRKRSAETMAPTAPSVAVMPSPVLLAPASPPVEAPAPVAPATVDPAPNPISQLAASASLLSLDATRVLPSSLATPAPLATPLPKPLDGTSLSDFLHLSSATSDAPTMVGRTPRPETPSPSGARRRGPAPRVTGEDVDSEATTMARQGSKGQPSAVPVFGRYEILAELGRGGMGVVYKARDPKIDRVVAIKSILTTHSDDESSEEYERRFRREVKAVGKLTHPAIVTVYDFIEDHLGRPAMVMEFVEGETLQQYVARQRPLLSRSLEIMIEAAEALDHAHAQGIVHRDMKPANILIGRDGRAKVSDFGIAKVGGGTNTNTKGGLVGTPAFMSPEQFLGRKVDGRSDIFSLGGILYWLCTGERPFAGDTIANLAYQIVHVIPGSVLKFNPDLPDALDEVIATSMAKDENNRYPSARDFAADLKALRDGRPLPSLAMTVLGDPAAMPDEDPEVISYEVLDESEVKS